MSSEAIKSAAVATIAGAAVGLVAGLALFWGELEFKDHVSQWYPHK